MFFFQFQMKNRQLQPLPPRQQLLHLLKKKKKLILL